ncbi:MAG TPA: HEAT repeat domain-containing protein [Polyangiaceae bacterium]|jgi:HEAT repeat protein
MLKQVGIITLLFVSSIAAAPAAPTHGHVDLTALKTALESGDEARTLNALGEVESSADAGAVPLVVALLARGASPKILARALGVSGALAKESSSATIAPYVMHRNAEVRRAAVHALIRTKGAPAVKALRQALRGSDPALRGVAADGLGALGVREAVPDLFVVLPRNVPEAAGAIGTLCEAGDCEKFLALLGKLPFDTMQSGFLPLLLRPTPDVPEKVKFEAIERLRLLATSAANELLQTALASYPKNGSEKVRRAIDAALHGHSVSGDGE